MEEISKKLACDRICVKLVNFTAMLKLSHNEDVNEETHKGIITITSLLWIGADIQQSDS